MLRPRAMLRRWPLGLCLPVLPALLRPALLGSRGTGVMCAVLLRGHGPGMVLVPGNVLPGRDIIAVLWLWFLSLE